MSHNNGMIIAPINIGSDIGEVLGTGSGDVGTNCTSSNINIFSKYKPNEIEGYARPEGSNPDSTPAQNSAFVTNGYALDAFGVTDLDDLKSTVISGWRYRGPNFRSGIKYYRALDFDGYYHNAPCPFEQTNGDYITIDLINESSPNTGIAFYILLKDGANANRNSRVPATSGSYNYMNSCLTVQDNIFEANGSRENLLGGCVGIILYDNWTNNHRISTSKFSESPIAITAQEDQDMYTLNLASLASTLNFGEYKAVACVRKAQDSILDLGGTPSYKYYPAYSSNLNPNPFTINFGGIEYYPITEISLYEHNTNNLIPTGRTTTTLTNFDVKVDLKNNWNGNFEVSTSSGSRNKFWLLIYGTLTIPGESNPRTIIRKKMWAPSFNISTTAGGTVSLWWNIDHLWVPTETDSETQPADGTVTSFSLSLWYHEPPDNPTQETYRKYETLTSLAGYELTYGTTL